MSILIKSARILEPGSPLHKQTAHIFISDSGVIKSIGKEIPKASKVLEGENLMVSIGWFDMCANFNDPGNEHKEDLNTGLATAAASGFTGVALLPNTKPCIESKNDVSYLMSHNLHSVTQVFPMGAITKGCKGEEFTEILDMHAAGAVAFTDGEHPVWNTDILLKTLQYLQKFDGLVINRPEDRYLTAFGSMNEGVVSTYLGLKGMPALAEEIMIMRDIELLKYAGGRLHFSNISTVNAVKQIAEARKSGLHVSCDVAIQNLLFEDSVLSDYDTNYKVNPPLRSSKDIAALDKAIKNDEIDVIVSAHTPQDEESKKLEFDHADFGMLGLQTFLPNIRKKVKDDDFSSWLPKFTVNPRKILNLTIPEIKVGQKANITVFDPDKEWRYDELSNLSKSINSPLLGQDLTGAVIGVVHNGRSFFNKLR